MENIGLLIAAVLGSAGIGGIVSALGSVIQLGRRARVSQNIERLEASLVASTQDATTPYLAEALRRERLRLASFTIVALAPGLAAYFVMVVLFILGYVAVVVTVARTAGLRQAKSLDEVDASLAPALWAVAIAVVIYGVAFAAVLDFLVEQRRIRFVRAALADNAIVGRVLEISTSQHARPMDSQDLRERYLTGRLRTRFEDDNPRIAAVYSPRLVGWLFIHEVRRRRRARTKRTSSPA